MPTPFATVIVLTWNSLQHIDECLSTMLSQSYSDYQVLVIDNSSGDGTPDYVRSRYPQVELVQLPQNWGYRRGNAHGMQIAAGKYIVVCNDDVKVEKTWLAEMVKVMEEDESIGLVTPMILMSDHPNLVNSAGNTVHFSGMYGPRAKGEARQRYESPHSLAAVSGCCFMIRRDLVLRLGGFSTDFDQFDSGWHASYEDVDLGWRVLMLGYRIKYVPTSVMYHHYQQTTIFAARFASYECGRYLVILRNYSLGTLCLLLPFLLVLEAMSWIYAISRGAGHVNAKARVMWWLLSHPRSIWSMRKKIQAVRTRSDLEILLLMDHELRLVAQLGGGRIAKASDVGFGLVSRFYYGVLITLLRVREYLAKSLATR